MKSHNEAGNPDKAAKTIGSGGAVLPLFTYTRDELLALAESPFSKLPPQLDEGAIDLGVVTQAQQLGKRKARKQ